jgi:hypothetical protein
VAAVTWIELPPARRRHTGFDRTGLSPRQTRRFDAGIVALVVAFGIAWTIAVVHSVQAGVPRPGLSARIAANPLSPDAPPPAAFLLDAALDRIVERSGYGGESGAVRVLVHEPGESPPLAGLVDEAGDDVSLEYVTEAGDTVPATMGPPPPGIWYVLLRARDGIRRVPDLAVLSMVPLTERRGGRIRRLPGRHWPHEEGGTPRHPAYAPPRGMIGSRRTTWTCRSPGISGCGTS